MLARWPGLHRLLRRRYLRRHAAALVLSDDMAVCRILGRFKLYADPQDWSISAHVMLDGIWEPRITETIVDLVQPGMKTIDVGANIGYFTILLAALVGERGSVMAVEPNPAMVLRLEASIMANGFEDRTTIQAVPVSSADGQSVTLAIPPHHPGGAQVTEADLTGWTKIDAITCRLDSLPGALDAHFVKIDAEGMEPAIWSGMQGMIAGSQLKIVIMEFTTLKSDVTARMIDEIIAAGFSLEWISEKGIEPIGKDALLHGTETLRMLLLRRS